MIRSHKLPTCIFLLRSNINFLVWLPATSTCSLPSDSIEMLSSIMTWNNVITSTGQAKFSNPRQSKREKMQLLRNEQRAISCWHITWIKTWFSFQTPSQSSAIKTAIIGSDEPTLKNLIYVLTFFLRCSRVRRSTFEASSCQPGIYNIKPFSLSIKLRNRFMW